MPSGLRSAYVNAHYTVTIPKFAIPQHIHDLYDLVLSTVGKGLRWEKDAVAMLRACLKTVPERCSSMEPLPTSPDGVIHFIETVQPGGRWNGLL